MYPLFFEEGDYLIFSSISFLFYFLPIVLILYFAVPFKLKNLVLLLSSLFFYFYGEPIYGFLMIGTILSAYIHGLLIGKFKGNDNILFLKLNTGYVVHLICENS